MTNASALPPRIRTKIDVTDACWEWVASRHPDGYGKVWWDGRVQYAHRVTYELLVGAIPEGLVTDHLCRNRGCVRPDHLEPVTQRTNLLRGDTLPASCAAKTTCPRGHEYDIFLDKGYRRCRMCSREHARATHRRKKAASRG